MWQGSAKIRNEIFAAFRIIPPRNNRNKKNNASKVYLIPLSATVAGNNGIPGFLSRLRSGTVCLCARKPDVFLADEDKIKKFLEFQEYVFRCPQTRTPAVSEEEVWVCAVVDVPYLCVSQCPLQYFGVPLKFGFDYICCFRLQDFRVLLKVNLCGYFGFTKYVRTYSKHGRSVQNFSFSRSEPK